MPLRWQGKKGRRGKIAGTLSSWTGTAAGTYTAPGTFLGRINALIYDWTGAIAGTFRSSSIIAGTITQQLEHWTGLLTGSTNRPPVWVTATSFSITQGATSYQFQATDADVGQTVTYALQGGSTLPSGWSLSTSGLLTLPSNAVAQQYPAFTVLASDGFIAVSRTFTVTVIPASGGSETLTWTAPTLNTAGQTFLPDGDPNQTSDRKLLGYRIYYGTSHSEVITSTTGAMVGTTQLVFVTASPTTISGLAAGTWYFDIRAVDGGGDESQGSQVVTRVV